MSNRAVLLLCALLAAGCATPDEGDVPEPSPLTRQFIRVSREVPAFGGVAKDNGTWVVYVLDAGQREAAEARLRDIFAEDAAMIAVRTRAARGTASQATTHAASELTRVRGVGTIGYDEATGYVAVGLYDVEALEPAQVKLDALGIPREQVLFKVRPTLVGL